MKFLIFIAGAALAQNVNIDTCAGCHGARGEGNPAAGAPRIAGQPQAYLERQLAAYADGRRENPVMAPFAKQLTPEQRSALAAYYAQLRAPAPRSAAAGSTSVSPRGRILATRGDEAIHVQACENCHGPGGAGQHNLNPYLAGLDARYLETALREWQEGLRKTDPSGQMTQIAKSLSDADIKALAAYYASRPPPQVASAVRHPAARENEKTRAGAGTQPREGVGVGGGEPTTGGGSQGPGGAPAK
jgi:cytochrome c553